MNNEFTIDKVSWHTKTEGNPETDMQIVERFWAIVDFLQKNDFVITKLLNGPEDIDSDFCIMSSNLTNDGLEIMASCYDKWLSKVDHGMSPNNFAIFEIYINKDMG